LPSLWTICELSVSFPPRPRLDMPEADYRPDQKSFIDVNPESDFPIQNLPFGCFRRDAGDRPRIGVALGAFAIDCRELEAAGLLAHPSLGSDLPFSNPTLNAFMALGPDAWRHVRSRLAYLLDRDTPTLRDNADLMNRALVRRDEIEMALPVAVGDYTDFYSSREHATNVGTMFRGPENALMPNWQHLPVGYHGRASSLVVSGTPIRRPCGQLKPGDDPPVFGPTRLLDYELEMGFFTGPGNPLGERIEVGRADRHVFGMVLVNDWSARDIQKWEYVPLGPFLGKSFATTVSPWVVTMAALEPFRCPGPEQVPDPLPYLANPHNPAFDVQLEVTMWFAGLDAPHVVTRSNFRYLYWSIYQQLAHHTVNGCNVRPGDLMASGTISGPSEESFGSLLERTWRGTRPIAFGHGASRTFIEDHDTVTLRAWAQGPGFRIGFGEASGQVLPAIV